MLHWVADPQWVIPNIIAPFIFTAVALTLSASGSNPIASMRFSNDNVTWSAWEAYATAKAWTLAGGDGVRTVYFQVRDSVGMVSGVFSDTIALDTTAPTGNIMINFGAAYANAVAATLSLAASDAGSGLGEMRFSNDNATWTPWEAYGLSKAWTLPAGEGAKTVYAQFRDNVGRVSSSVNDTIVLDTVAPTGSVTINGGAAFANSPAVTLALSASDAGSGVAQMRFSNDNATWSPWENYAATKAWSLMVGDGQKTVYVQFRDGAMNGSSSYSDTIRLDATPPTGNIVVNGGAAVTNSTSVTLSLSASDAGSGVTQMRFSNNNVTWSGWEAFSARRTAWNLTSGDGTKTVYAQFRDAAGNTSGVRSDSIFYYSGISTGVEGWSLYK